MTGRSLFKGLGKVLGGSHGLAGPFVTSSAVLDHYVAGFPTLQNAIDAVPGWLGAMPPDTGLTAGDATLFADARITWLLEECRSVDGRSVLELGPLEAFHTYMLHRGGAAEIDAVEANALAFFRCLITKEALKLDRAHFFLGDFVKWLEARDKRYDLVVASGVLHRSQDPVRLLQLICERTDSFYLWTHYFDDVAMPRGDLRRAPFSERIESKECRGVRLRLHERNDIKARRDPVFRGGVQDRHFWTDREDLLALIEAFGFDNVKIADEQPEHPNGPIFAVFAQRTSAGQAACPEPSTAGSTEANVGAEASENSNQDPPPPVPLDAGSAPEFRVDVSKPPDSNGEMSPTADDDAVVPSNVEASHPPPDEET